MWTRIDRTEAHRALLSHPALRRAAAPQALLAGRWPVVGPAHNPAQARPGTVFEQSALQNNSGHGEGREGALWTVTFFFAGDYQRPVALNISHPPLLPYPTPTPVITILVFLLSSLSTAPRLSAEAGGGAVCQSASARAGVQRLWSAGGCIHPPLKNPPGVGTEGGGGGERETERDRETGRDRNTWRDRQTERDRETERDRNTWT